MNVSEYRNDITPTKTKKPADVTIDVEDVAIVVIVSVIGLFRHNCAEGVHFVFDKLFKI